MLMRTRLDCPVCGQGLSLNHTRDVLAAGLSVSLGVMTSNLVFVSLPWWMRLAAGLGITFGVAALATPLLRRIEIGASMSVTGR